MFVVTKVSMRNVFVLRHGDYVIILIEYGRCAATFDLLVRTGSVVII